MHIEKDNTCREKLKPMKFHESILNQVLTKIKIGHMQDFIEDISQIFGEIRGRDRFYKISLDDPCPKGLSTDESKLVNMAFLDESEAPCFFISFDQGFVQETKEIYNKKSKVRELLSEEENILEGVKKRY
jgi:hypothetical protein